MNVFATPTMLAVTVLVLTVMPVHGQPGKAGPAPKQQEWKDGSLLKVGDRQYTVRFVDLKWSSPGHVERSKEICLWEKNKLYIIDPQCPRWNEPIACSWPVQEVSADHARAVVTLPTKKHGEHHIGVADLKKNVLLADFVVDSASIRRWIFSADGRWLVPVDGLCGDFFFFDITNKKLHRRNVLGLKKASDSHYWTGTVVDGKNVQLFIRAYLGEHGRLHVPLADPTMMQFHKGGPPIYQIYKQEDQKLLVRSEDEKAGLWIDTKTWQAGPVVPKGDPQLIATGTPDPQGRWYYWLDRFKGLSIHDAKTGKLVAKGPGQDGWSFNALTLGVTFNTAGDVAVVPSPYSQCLTFLNTTTHKMLYRATDLPPVAGAFLFDPVQANQPGTCLIVTTFLPYE